MQAEDFSVWLAAISGMSAAQRTEGLAALQKAADAASGTATTGKRSEDALGTTGVERVERQGCPHGASREIVGSGRSDGLLRYRCKACRRTFNALAKTPMAHLRKKEKRLDHAQAMIEGKSLAKTAKLCGVHPTTAFRWRHRFLRAPADDKPRTLSGIVEADETFILKFFKGRWSDLPRGPRKRGGKARHPGPIRITFPSSSPATGKARPSTPFCRRSRAPPLARRSSDASRRPITSVGDGGLPIAGFARRSRHSLPPPSPRRASRLPRPRIWTSTTSTPTTAASSNGSPASTASTPRTCQATSAGAELSKPGANPSTSTNGSSARSETAHINR